MYNVRSWLAAAILVSLVQSQSLRGELVELAFYHLGEDDGAVTAGSSVATTTDILEGRDMSPMGDVTYSNDTPPGIDTRLSVAFDGEPGNYLFTDATPWHSLLPNFRVGMEAWIKVDPNLQGAETVPFGNGTGYYLSIDPDGYPLAHAGVSTPPGETPIEYGEWQHVAFWTTGSFWQVYLNGEPQLDPTAQFNYGSPSGLATLGADRDGAREFQGLIDEHRVFTWTGPFNAGDLLFYTQRGAGDVNEDGSVNQADYDIWRMNVGADLSQVSLLEGRGLGDLNIDRQIDLDDFGLIKANLTAGQQLIVPEPMSAIALLIASGYLIAQARRPRSRVKLNTVSLIAVVLLLLHSTTHVQAQSQWTGGDGNWSDPKWTGGSGPGGAPNANQNVTLPQATGTVDITTDLQATVGSFGSMSQQGGLLNVAPTGRVRFAGDFRIAEGTNTSAGLNLEGELTVGQELAVGYGVGDGGGGAIGSLSIDGAANLRVGANLDTWWDDGAEFSITGGNAEIEVGGTFFLGTATTMNAHINSADFSTVRALGSVNFAGGNGTLNVDFVDGYVPTLGTSWILFDSPAIGGQIPNVNLPDLGPGRLLRLNYEEGGELGEVVSVDYVNTLNLKIDPTDGSVAVENPVAGGSSLEIDGYIIRSPLGSLVTANFAGLGAAGWAPGLPPSQSNSLLSETSLTGSMTINTGQSLPLGNVFELAGDRDLVFEYRLASGRTVTGTVQYGEDVPGDFNSNGTLDLQDIDALTAASATGNNEASFDLNSDALVNQSDVQIWVKTLRKSWIGDANLDLEFSSTDLVVVFQAGKYELNEAAVWSQGDWTGDGRFSSSDLVAAFQDGGYELGPVAASAVPEPTAWLLIHAANLAAVVIVRRRQSVRHQVS
jgi:hypothetical protein